MKPLSLAFMVFCLLSAAACGSPTPAPSGSPTAATAAASAAASALPAIAVPSAGPSTRGPGTQPVATPSGPAATATAAAVAAAIAAATTPPPPTVVATSTANPTIAGGLIGLWQGDNNSFYLINIDGTWNWDQDAQKVLITPENQGHWWLEGDILRIQDTAGKAPCPLAQVGAYQAQLSGDKLTLTAVADLCSVRIDQTAGQYTRQAVGP